MSGKRGIKGRPKYLFELASIYSLLFFFIISLAMNSVDADIVTANVTIVGSSPTVSNIRCCFKDSDTGSYADSDCRDAGSATPYTPSGGKYTDIMCNFTVSDANGWQDMIDGWVNMTWYRTSVAWNAAEDYDVLYANASCSNVTAPAPTGMDILYECGIYEFRYWADGGNWSVLVNLSDGSQSGVPSEGNLILGNQTSIWVTSAINFGSMGMGQNGSQWQPNVVSVNATINNTGNTMFDLLVEGDDSGIMNCTIGEIPLENISYDTVYQRSLLAEAPPVACGQLTTASEWDGDCTDFQLSDCSDNCPGAVSTKSTYWGISIPKSGVGGTCGLIMTIVGTQG
jgi:hypothetical protein